MRLLVTFSGGLGHLEPLLPLARAAQAAGHEVVFSGRPWMTPKVEAAGFRHLPAGTDRGLTPRRQPLLPVDLAREALDLRDGFAGRIARERAPGLLAIARAWRPDLLLWDETDLALPVIAERLGIPHASIVTLLAGTFVTPALFAPVLDELRAAHGLAPDPELAMLRRHLVLYPGPPSYRDPAQPLPDTGRAMRPVLNPPPPGSAPSWLGDLGHDGRPVVYLTLGTVFHVESGDLFERAVSGLRELSVDLVVTVGDEIDPAELGPQPGNVRIERFIPQALVLPRADLVVSHGGSGSVIGALIHGRPMVLLAMGADQPLNGARVRALGLGRVLDPIAATPSDIRDAGAAVLADPASRAAAERLRDEITSLPGPDEAVRWVEAVATSGIPLRARPGLRSPARSTDQDRR